MTVARRTRSPATRSRRRCRRAPAGPTTRPRPATPVARSAAEVVGAGGRGRPRRARRAGESVCRACPRLVHWREDVAERKRASYAAEPYWGRPIAGWGDAEPRVLVAGAGAGGQRRQPHRPDLHRRPVAATGCSPRCTASGWPAQATSVHAGDGQRLVGTRMVAAVRCAPPDNKPTPVERDTCAPLAAARAGAGAAVAAGGGVPRVVRVGRRCSARCARLGVRRAAPASRGSATAPRSVTGPDGGR